MIKIQHTDKERKVPVTVEVGVYRDALDNRLVAGPGEFDVRFIQDDGTAKVRGIMLRAFDPPATVLLPHKLSACLRVFERWELDTEQRAPITYRYAGLEE